MARPHKYNLLYFPLDVDFFEDHKTLMIEEDYGFKGGYVALRLMAMVYEQGYYLDWKDKQEISIAKRLGNGFTSSLVMDVLKSCLKHDLFSKALFDEHMVLTSNGIQKRWLQVMRQLRRKVIINSKLWVVSAEEMRLTSEETFLPEALTPPKESKVNEIKVNEIKKNVADKPPPKKSVSNNKKTEEPEPYWKELVAVWFDFGKEKFNEEPSFDGQDPKIFKRVIERLKKRAEHKKIEWTIDSGPKRLRIFLEMAFSDKWISENFLLSNLEKQFDKIVQNQSSKTSKPVITDLDYMFERYCDGELERRLILPSHYEDLKSKGLVEITNDIVAQRIKSLTGTTNFTEGQLCQDYENGKRSKLVIDDIHNLQKLAVIEHFKKLKEAKYAEAQ